MTVMPPTVSELLGQQSPQLGGSAEVDAIIRFIDSVGADAASYRLGLNKAQAELIVCDTDATRAIHTRISTLLMSGVQKIARDVASAKAGFMDYAIEIERIHRAAENVSARAEAELASLRIQIEEIAEIAQHVRVVAPPHWNDPPPPTLPEPQLDSRADGMDAHERAAVRHTLTEAYEARWRVAAIGWRQACDALATEKTQWQLLLSERREAENRLLRVLHTTSIGSLITLGGVNGGGIGVNRAIAHGIAGEFLGVRPQLDALRTRHELLPEELFPGNDGDDVWSAPPAAAAVAVWWNSIGAAEQSRLIAEVPWVIGNLPGITMAARDRANRQLLQFFAHNVGALDPEQLQLMGEVQRVLDREEHELAAAGKARPPVQIVSLDITGAVPRAAIGYGDNDTAPHTSWLSPGMESDAHHALGSWDTAGRNLFHRQARLLHGTGDSAVVVWLGYDTPDLKDTLSSQGVLASRQAVNGAERLALELDGSQTARLQSAHGPAKVHVVAHSYGTTTAATALTLVAQPVSSFTMLASAGLDRVTVPNLEALHVAEVTPGQLGIYTTHASQDHLAPLGAGAAARAQPNPEAIAFGFEQLSPVLGGALSFSAEGDSEHRLKGTDGHSVIGEGSRAGLIGVSASRGRGYLDSGTQSLDGVAQITTGRIGDALAASFTPTQAECVGLRVNVHGGGLSVKREVCEGAR